MIQLKENELKMISSFVEIYDGMSSNRFIGYFETLGDSMLLINWYNLIEKEWRINSFENGITNIMTNSLSQTLF